MKYKNKDAAHGYELAVDAHPDSYMWSDWPVYPNYEVGEYEGHRFVYAQMAEPKKQLLGRRRYRPLSRPTAALFLEFARWPETEHMDRKPFETEKNEAAARVWAEINGVLGLDSTHQFTVFDKASDAIEHSLGMRGGIRRRRRNQGYGGREETVEAFAREAWIANMTLNLFEAATNPEGPDLGIIAAYMSDRKADLGDHDPSARELHGKSPEYARSWALDIVEEIVEDRMRGHVWPLPIRYYYGHGDFVGHKQGWAFDSLLGAMWLQMMWLMLGRVRRCEWCGKLLDVDPEHVPQTAGDAGERRKPRNDRRFCRSSDGVKDKCKADWNYHRGRGKSSKNKRREARDRGRRKS